MSWPHPRLPQLHNYWPVVPARQKLTRFVRSEGFPLPQDTQPSLAPRLVAAPKSATHERKGNVHFVLSCTWEAETQKSKFASRSSPLFRVRVPSPQNYAMVKRVSSNLVILVSLEQRQVFSWRWYTQGPNSLHQQAMMAGAQIWRYFSNLPHLEKPLLIRQLKALLFTRSISLYWPTSLYSLHSLCSLYSLYRTISLYWIWGPMRLHSSETICVQIKWLTLQKQKTKKWIKIYFI